MQDSQKHKYIHQIGYFRLISAQTNITESLCTRDTSVNAHKTNAPTNIPKNTFVYLCLAPTSWYYPSCIKSTVLCILTSPGRKLTAAASASSAASGPWACPGSWCQSSRWATPGCQWLKSTPASRPECSNYSSGRPCPRNTSPKPLSG